MAALLLGAIGISAQKIKEKRDEKKAKKALTEWEDEQVEEYRRKAVLAENARGRKSDEAREERRGGGSGSGRRSESEERLRDGEGREELPPPRYEDVVAGAKKGGNSSMLNV